MLKIDIVSGFLGAGKTTFIKRILKTNISKEKIVLVENEFGDVNIDSDFMADSNIEVSEISSGCICCSLVGDFSKNLTEIINKYNPDRIIVEPSGVGKLSDVIKAVFEAQLGDYLNTYVCIVDSTKAKVYARNFKEFFVDQIANAKTVLLSRCDIASEAKLNDAIAVVKGLNSECNLITTSIDELEDEVLLDAYEGKKDNMVDELMEEVKHHHHHHDEEDCCCGHHHEHHHHDEEECCCGHHHEHHHHDEEECCCGHHHGHHHHSGECGCGHHHADEVFNSIGFETTKTYDYNKLKEILELLANTNEYGEVIRAKGIIKTDLGWKKFNITPNELLIEDNKAIIIGKICVIGSHLCEHTIKSLF